jgi:hypothetical protein
MSPERKRPALLLATSRCAAMRWSRPASVVSGSITGQDSCMIRVSAGGAHDCRFWLGAVAASMGRQESRCSRSVRGRRRRGASAVLVSRLGGAAGGLVQVLVVEWPLLAPATAPPRWWVLVSAWLGWRRMVMLLMLQYSRPGLRFNTTDQPLEQHQRRSLGDNASPARLLPGRAPSRPASASAKRWPGSAGIDPAADDCLRPEARRQPPTDQH